MMRILPALAAVAMLVTAGTAHAHAKLTGSTPAANATVKPTASAALHFSEALVAKLSTVEVVMLDMPGMVMTAPMKMPLKTSLGADRKSLNLAFPKPLPAGTYKLDYHVVSGDTHRINGTIAFKVK